MSLFYFDASALSEALVREQDRRTCLAMFSGQEHKLLVSEFNIRELVATFDPPKREGLLRFASDLTSGWNVVASPHDLLRRTATALQLGNTHFDASLKTPVIGFIQVLADSNEAEAAVLLEDARSLNRKLNATFKEAGARARKGLHEQGLREAMGTNGARFTRSVLANEDPQAFARFWIQAMLEPGSPELSVARVLAVPEWRCFLVSFCLHFFDKVIRLENFGKSHRPEASDILQAIYLARVGFYVVADQNHYRHARRVTKLVQTAWKEPVATVLPYDQFVQLHRGPHESTCSSIGA